MVRGVFRALAVVFLVAPVLGQMPDGAVAYGPYNAVFLDVGTGLSKPLAAGDVLLDPGAQWSIYSWVRVAKPMVGDTVIAVVGNPDFAGSRALGTQNGKVALYSGRDAVVRSEVALTPGSWHLVAATFSQADAHLYADGAEIGHGVAAESALAPLLSLAPATSSVSEAKHFGGELSGLTLMRRALAASELSRMYSTPPDFGLLEFADGSIRWPVQTRGQAGMSAPQDPSTLPHSNASPQTPVAQPVAPASDTPGEPGEWILRGGWRMQAAPKVTATPEAICAGSYDASGWMEAVVPGTVLTTMVARGVYPDPDYGLNNLAIPESLNKQDYWYRKEFPTPVIKDRQNLTLTFEGINYAASVWLNGKRLGEIQGAFIRGSFDVTAQLKKSGMNVLAVRISPPPHPGIPHEQSIKGGPGENGGIMVLDGPTFAATEGWDWIPGVRDRNSGIWQDVTLDRNRSRQRGGCADYHHPAATRWQRGGRGDCRTPQQKVRAAHPRGCPRFFRRRECNQRSYRKGRADGSTTEPLRICAVEGEAAQTMVAERVRRTRPAHYEDLVYGWRQNAVGKEGSIWHARDQLRAFAAGCAGQPEAA